MKLFLPLLALCAIHLSRAQLQDLPEVAAAKAAHFEAVRRAELVIATAKPEFHKSTTRPKVEETSQHQLGVNVHDTPEVAAAKAAHYDAVKKAEYATAAANATGRASVSTVQHGRPQSSTEGYQNVIHIEIPTTGQQQYPSSGHYKPTGHQHQHYPSSSGHYPSSGHHHTHYPNHGPYPSSYPTSDHYPTNGQYPNYYPPTDHHHHSTTYYPDRPHHHHHVKSVPQTTQHQLGEIVRDTPEVAAAKAEHFEAVRRAEQAALSSNPNDDGSYVVVHQGNTPIVAVSSESVYLPDTPEVAAAKAIHFEAIRRAQGAASPHVVLMPVIQYPNTIPFVAVPQTSQHQLGVNVQDTPEVAAAKAAHLEAVRRAQLSAAKNALEKSTGFAPTNDYFYNPTRPYGQV